MEMMMLNVTRASPEVPDMLSTDVYTNVSSQLSQPSTASFLEAHPVQAVIYLTITGLGILIGFGGNLVVIVLHSTFKKLKYVSHEFIINMAIADLLITSFAQPMCILGVTHGEAWFRVQPVLCKLVACVCLSACYCAFFNLSLLTSCRYIYVCHRSVYDKISSRNIILLACGAVWVLAFLVEMPNFLGWGGHYFDRKSKQCMWDRTASLSYSMLVAAGLVMAPLLGMIAVHSLLFRKMYQSRMKMMTYSQTNEETKATKILYKKRAFVETRSIQVVVVVFVLCWFPYSITHMVDVTDQAPAELYLWVTLLAHLHSSAGFIVYFFSNDAFKKAVIKVFGSKKGDLSQSESSSPSSKGGSSTNGRVSVLSGIK